MDEQIRLSKLMAQQGLSSRREADKLISAGQVLVNGEIIKELGTKVHPGSDIKLAAIAQRKREKLATLILNKPAGWVSNQPEKGYEEAASLIIESNRSDNHEDVKRKIPPASTLNVAGRLDIDSSGLLVLTQDGTVARKLIGPQNNIEKEYRVRIKGAVTDHRIKQLTHGLSLDGRQLRPAIIKLIGDDLLMFVLQEGRKRQIRRMCELVDLEVRTLTRVRIGRVKLGQLPRGKWRHLSQQEQF